VKKFVVFFCLPLTLAAAADLSQPQVSTVDVSRTVTLNEALKLGLQNNLSILAERTVLEIAGARQSQARAANYPKVLGTAILAPINSVEGNAINAYENGKWGPWLTSTLQILQPVYTWGKISSYKEAAAQGLEVAKAQTRKSESELVYEIKELYYGAVLAEQLVDFLQGGKNDVDELVKKATEDQAKKRPDISRRDFYRLKIFAAEASYRLEEAKKLRELARHALSLKLGFHPDTETLPSESALSPIELPIPEESLLRARLATERPELRQLHHGIAAKRALLEAEKANKFPMLFLGGQLELAYSNVRQKQNSPFAFDPYNRSQIGVGIGVQWNFDFATTLANEQMGRAEISELERKEEYAQVGFVMELKKSLADLREMKTRVEESREAFQVGKRWLVSETMGYSAGLGEVKNVIDAYLARAKTAKDHWEAIYRLNMAWAGLDKTVGSNLTPNAL